MDKAKQLKNFFMTFVDSKTGRLFTVVLFLACVIGLISFCVNWKLTRDRAEMCWAEFHTQECIDDRNARWKHEFEVTNKENYRKYKASQGEK